MSAAAAALYTGFERIDYFTMSAAGAALYTGFERSD